MSGTYAFGHGDLAARRLDLLARVFESPSRALLVEATAGRPRPALAVDVGCGPGHTTRLLADVTGAVTTLGLDFSPAFVDRASAATSGGVPVHFAVHDVTKVPFPQWPANIIYARLVLAHLPEPEQVAARWAGQLDVGGRLVLDEVELIEPRHPVLHRYETMVAAAVAGRGADMYVGPRLARMALAPDVHRVVDRVVAVDVRTADAAAMFAMNLPNWRDDPAVTAVASPAEIDEVAAGLEELTRSPATGDITWQLRHMVLERSP